MDISKVLSTEYLIKTARKATDGVFNPYSLNRAFQAALPDAFLKSANAAIQGLPKKIQMLLMKNIYNN